MDFFTKFLITLVVLLIISVVILSLLAIYSPQVFSSNSDDSPVNGPGTGTGTGSGSGSDSGSGSLAPRATVSIPPVNANAPPITVGAPLPTPGSVIATVGTALYSPVQWGLNNLKCIGVSSNDNGTKLTSYTCNNNDSKQVWSLDKLGHIFQKGTKKCMNINNAGSNGTLVNIWDCDTTNTYENQKFIVNSNGTIESKQYPGKCLNLNGMATDKDGQEVQLWDCKDSAGVARGGATWNFPVGISDTF